MVGFRPVIEADEGYLTGGRVVCDGPVFESFCYLFCRSNLDAIEFGTLNGWGR